MTYQHVLVLSTSRRRGGTPYPQKDALPEYVTDIPTPNVIAVVSGDQEAVIETYTVEFNRDNTPSRAYIVGRTGRNGSGERFVANHGDIDTLRHLSQWEGEKIGRKGRVRNDGQRNLFTLASVGKL